LVNPMIKIKKNKHTAMAKIFWTNNSSSVLMII